MMKRWHDSPDCECHRMYGCRLIPEDEVLTEEDFKYYRNAPEHQRACYRETDAQNYLTACRGYADELGIWEFAEMRGMTVDEADEFLNPELRAK